ncbi:hypothetical protein OKA04_20755 [Luteolibacter flavescens]|uniref:Uncharacterized protein n=1 Tax=Luteolibacter flavescens TaxID=1859460 RepID=A0ABT3FUT6_9BACT|nr:hypothetical protein [Luteolibacter flavescens]MCW1887182.1 hypothetical protein [Luteolibacter flavescens]
MIFAASVVLFWRFIIERSISAIKTGAEFALEDAEPDLRRELGARLGWTSLPHGSVEKAWVRGFQDHTALYRIRLSPADFATLRGAVLTSTAEDMKVDDADDLSLCPSDFGTATPQAPTETRIPEWWEVPRLSSFDSLLWNGPEEGYWFCYDGQREILFLLSRNS